MSRIPSQKALEARNVSDEVIDNLTHEEIVYISKNNHSARSFFTGYTYEYHFERLLKCTEGVSDVRKPDDHDRKNNKSDFICTYRGKTVRFQVKSIQTNSIIEENGRYSAVVQNDASGKHWITLPNGERIRTTNYQYGEYDILVVCMINFTRKMDFCFKLNSECTPTSNKGIDGRLRKYLMSSCEKITYPLEGSWTTDLVGIMNRVGSEHPKTIHKRIISEQMTMDI